MATLKSQGGNWVPLPRLSSTCTPASLRILEPEFLQEESHRLELWWGEGILNDPKPSWPRAVVGKEVTGESR